MRKVLFVALLLFTPAVASAQNVSVSDAMTMTSTAGEAQSTIVPPGHPKCNEGRFLVTNDRLAPPNSVVSGRDLNQTTGIPVASTFTNMGALATDFDADYKKSKYYFGTNDHDLITLPNGDVLYLTGAFTRMPLGPPGARPLPIWMQQLFKDTYRNICEQYDAAGNCVKSYPFGPNARSTMLVFRSTDCGQTFDFVSEMDPVRFGGATCALPQFGGGPNNTVAPWDMGGTDGQVSMVDPTNGNIYMVFQCVGYMPDSMGTNPKLDPNNKINKTLVLMSDTGGTSWKGLGYIDQAQWRFGVVPQTGGELQFGYANSVLTGKKSTTGTYAFDSTGTQTPAGKWSWMGWWDFTSDPNLPLTKFHANVFGMPVVARRPGGKGLVLAFPDKFGAQGLGYRVFFYDPAKANPFAEVASILPTKSSASNVAFHLAVADPGSGPVLLYWTDLDSAAKTMTVRGRLVTGGDEVSDDFVVSRAGGAEHSFQLPAAYWLGDYHTAGAYRRKVGQVTGSGQFKIDLRTTVYAYYPIWIEADGLLHYSRVEYAIDPLQLVKSPKVSVKSVKLLTVPAGSWKPGPGPVELRRIAHPPLERFEETPRKEGMPVRRERLPAPPRPVRGRP